MFSYVSDELKITAKYLMSHIGHFSIIDGGTSFLGLKVKIFEFVCIILGTAITIS